MYEPHRPDLRKLLRACPATGGPSSSSSISSSSPSSSSSSPSSSSSSRLSPLSSCSQHPLPFLTTQQSTPPLTCRFSPSLSACRSLLLPPATGEATPWLPWWRCGSPPQGLGLCIWVLLSWPTHNFNWFNISLWGGELIPVCIMAVTNGCFHYRKCLVLSFQNTTIFSLIWCKNRGNHDILIFGRLKLLLENVLQWSISYINSCRLHSSSTPWRVEPETPPFD